MDISEQSYDEILSSNRIRNPNTKRSISMLEMSKKEKTPIKDILPIINKNSRSSQKLLPTIPANKQEPLNDFDPYGSGICARVNR